LQKFQTVRKAGGNRGRGLGDILTFLRCHLNVQHIHIIPAYFSGSSNYLVPVLMVV